MTDASAWRAWKEATFGTEFDIWHDGLYTGRIVDLKGAAREETLRMLRLGVSLGDSHAAEALAAMRDDGAVDEMRARLRDARGAERVRIALAIHAVAPDPALATELTTVLENAASWSDRIDAAMGLRRFAGEIDERALLDAVARDPEYLVRYHAAESLLVRFHVVPAEIASHEAIFERITGPREGDVTDAHRAAFREARALFEALRPPRTRADA